MLGMHTHQCPPNLWQNTFANFYTEWGPSIHHTFSVVYHWLPCCPSTSGLQSVTVLSIPVYQWLSHLSQPINDCLVYLSLSVAISAYQWLSHLSQPIRGNLSLSMAVWSISAYQWLSHHLSLSMAISAYQQLSHLSQPIISYLSLSVAVSSI